MTHFLIKVVINILSWLPLRLNHALGSFIGKLLYLMPNKARSTANTNIKLCFPDISIKQQKRLVRQTLQQTGKTITELGPLWNWSMSRIQGLVKKIHNLELLDSAAKSPQGLLCLTPHLGCWEICSLYFAEKYPAICLYRPPRLKTVANFIENSRQRFGTTLVPISASGIKALYKGLSNGKTIGILPDQDPGQGRGIYASFFDIQCNTMPLVAKLIKKTKPNIILMYATRLDRGQGYEIIIEDLNSLANETDDHNILSQMNLAIENNVKKYPAQYQWTYKCFKYQPDDTQFYRE